MSGSKPSLRFSPCFICRDLLLLISGLLIADSSKDCSFLFYFPGALPHHHSSGLFLSLGNLLSLILLGDRVKLTAWLIYLTFSLIHSINIYCDSSENLTQGIWRTDPALKELLIQCSHTIITQCDCCCNRSTIIMASTHTKLILSNILFPLESTEYSLIIAVATIC